jgi:hypothetical protein
MIYHKTNVIRSVIYGANSLVSYVALELKKLLISSNPTYALAFTTFSHKMTKGCVQTCLAC